MAATAEASVIETPCWVHGAATAGELALVHVWNDMVQMQVDAGDDETVCRHLFDLCRSLSER